MTEPNSAERLPCGCVMATDPVSQTFIFEPHALDCELYLYVLAESARQGKPTTVIDTR